VGRSGTQRSQGLTPLLKLECEALIPLVQGELNLIGEQAIGCGKAQGWMGLDRGCQFRTALGAQQRLKRLLGQGVAHTIDWLRLGQCLHTLEQLTGRT
jgi:hypothetical protein